MLANKNIVTGVLILFFVMLGFVAYSQSANAEKSTNNVIESIRKANSAGLSSSLGTTIDLSLPDKDGTFSRTQAEMILRDFFRKNPPKSFVVKQQGSSTDGSRFTIASYVTTSGSSYRTYFLMKKTNGIYLLQLLQFELE